MLFVESNGGFIVGEYGEFDAFDLPPLFAECDGVLEEARADALSLVVVVDKHADAAGMCASPFVVVDTDHADDPLADFFDGDEPIQAWGWVFESVVDVVAGLEGEL